MALKGTTRIELTNVKTGEKEVIEKDNLVTNAVASILVDNPFAWQLKSSYSGSYLTGNMLPLCPNLFGGILLFEDSIPEDVNQLYAQSDNKLVGYSSNNVNDKTDTMRGSMNQTESGPLEDGAGYRFVFDFATSQANGTISSLGLTSKWGGIAGYGNSEWANTQSPTVFYQVNTSITDFDIGYAYQTMLHYDEDTGEATSAFVSAQGTIKITRIKLHTKSWKLSKILSLIDDSTIIDTQIIMPEVFAGTTVSGARRYYNFCDGGDGYIWGFEHAGNAEGNSAESASINWIKISLEDFSFEEGTWSIDAQIYKMGKRPNNPGTGAGTYSYRDVDDSNCAILDGYLYCLRYDLTGLYKINLSNTTDITFIEHPNGSVFVNINNFGGGYNSRCFWSNANLVVMGNKICMHNGWVNVDSIVTRNYSSGYYAYGDGSLNDGWMDTSNIGTYPQNCTAGLHPLKIGPLMLYYQTYAAQSSIEVHARLLLAAPYLATINNLATPVEKTADKTMKITYILREE